MNAKNTHFLRGTLLIIALFVLGGNAVYAQNTTPFVTTWEVTKYSLGITIPTNGNFAYSYTVDWGDSSADTTHTGDAIHTYAAAGSYTVRIYGTFPSIYFTARPFGRYDVSRVFNGRKIKTIKQWGDNPWKSMNSAFSGCENLTIEATAGNPDLSNVTDMAFMFHSAATFNQYINGWDVSNVTTMEGMFAAAAAFNQDIDRWDVSNVTNMRIMLGGTAFNQDIGGWDVSNVTTMSQMFWDADAFNQDLGGWDVSNVTTMSRMFWSADAFNQNIGGWDVSNVTVMDEMFRDATAFNQNIGGWDVSNVTTMASMFSGATLSTENYDALLRGWSALPTLVSGINFHGGSSKYCGEEARNTLTNPPNSWNITADGGEDTAVNCARYQASFTFASNRLTRSFGDAAFTFTPTGGSGTGAITYASGDTTVASVSATSGEVTIAGVGSAIITATKAADANYNAATTSYTLSVKISQAAFVFANQGEDKINGDDAFTISPTGGSGTGAITWESSDTTVATISATSGEVTIVNVGTTTITATKASDTTYGPATASYDLTVVPSSNANLMSLSVSNADDGGAISLTPAFDAAVTAYAAAVDDSVSGVTVTAETENSAAMAVTLVSLSEGNTVITVRVTAEDGVTVKDYVITITSFPADAFVTTWEVPAYSLGITIPTNSAFVYSYTVDWGDGSTDTTTYTGDAGYEYAAAGSYTVSISGTFPSIYFNAGSGSTNSRKIKTIKQWGDNPWESMNSAFEGCENLTIEATAGNPDLSNVTDMAFMFGDTAVNQDISGWDVSNVTDMSYMFFNATAFNRDLNGWGGKTSNVTDMSRMFYQAHAFNQNIGRWDVSNVTDMSTMFWNASAFNQDIGGWDVSNVTDMSGMFNGTAFNQDLSGWDVSNVTDMQCYEVLMGGTQQCLWELCLLLLMLLTRI